MNNPTRIDTYLFGKMPPADAAAFEADMAADPALAAEVQQQRLEHRALELLAEQELRANMTAWKAEKAQTEAAPAVKVVYMGNTRRRLIFRIAAAASVLLLIGFFAQRLLTGPDAREMAAARFEESATSVRVRGRSDVPPALRPALDQMAAGQYAAALQALDAVSEPDLSAKVVLLQGECRFRLGEYPAAVERFRAAAATGDPADQEEAEYLLLLSYMASGQYAAEAKALREKILGDAGHGYFGEVKEME